MKWFVIAFLMIAYSLASSRSLRSNTSRKMRKSKKYIQPGPIDINISVPANNSNDETQPQNTTTNSIELGIFQFPSTAVDVVPTSTPLYYLQTNEGVVQHIRQLRILGEICRLSNRQLIALPFKSPHYPDMPYVDICSIFVLDANVICSNETLSSVFTRMKCFFNGIHNQPMFLDHPKFPLPIIEQPNYTEIPCIAGYINRENGFYPRNGYRNFTYPLYHPIQQSYRELLPKFIEQIYIHANNKIKKSRKTKKYTMPYEYILIHWRRGDQLKTRCKSTYKYHDSSVNCGSMHEFVDALGHTLAEFIPDHNNSSRYVKYIATNEKDDSTITYLHKLGFIVFSDVKPLLLSLKPGLTSVDEFIVELMMMCDADYFISWGESSIHRYAYECRAQTPDKLKGFIHDDVSSSRYSVWQNNG